MSFTHKVQTVEELQVKQSVINVEQRAHCEDEFIVKLSFMQEMQTETEVQLRQAGIIDWHVSH